MGLLPAWIQTSLRIRAVWSGPMLFAYAGVTLSRIWHQMDTRIRKCSNSDLIVITSCHSWGHLLQSYDPRLNITSSGSNFMSGFKMFGMPKNSPKTLRRFIFVLICMSILPFVRPSWSHLVKSCSLRLFFVWSAMQSGVFSLKKTIRSKHENSR
jgi:hypothetical protein